jgi:hypothetical protein
LTQSSDNIEHLHGNLFDPPPHGVASPNSPADRRPSMSPSNADPLQPGSTAHCSPRSRSFSTHRRRRPVFHGTDMHGLLWGFQRGILQHHAYSTFYMPLLRLVRDATAPPASACSRRPCC